MEQQSNDWNFIDIVLDFLGDLLLQGKQITRKVNSCIFNIP